MLNYSIIDSTIFIEGNLSADDQKYLFLDISSLVNWKDNPSEISISLGSGDFKRTAFPFNVETIKALDDLAKTFPELSLNIVVNCQEGPYLPIEHLHLFSNFRVVLIEFNLSYDRRTDISFLRNNPLRELTLYSCVNLSPLSNHPSIEKLDVRYSCKSGDVISTLRHLESLSVVGSLSSISVLEENKKLKKIAISRVGPKSGDYSAFPRLSALEEITFDRVAKLRPQDLAYLNDCPNLGKVVVFDYKNIKDISWLENKNITVLFNGFVVNMGKVWAEDTYYKG